MSPARTAAFCLALLPAPCLAQTTAPETIQVTATRTPIAADKIAAGVTVIDSASIAARGYTTLADALSAVPGLHLVQSGGPGANASLFVRGTNSNQVQVLVDGVPVNDATGPGEAFNFGVDTLADIERIEIVRGPLSAVYGSGAIGGVVNIITRRGAPGAPHGSVMLAAGLPAAALAQLRLSGGAQAVDYAVSAESQSNRGFDATPARERSVYTGERDGSRSRSGTVALGYTMQPGTRIGLDLRGRSGVIGYDDVNYPAFDDPNDTGRDNELLARVGVHSVLLAGVWTTDLSWAGDQHFRRYVNLLDLSDPNAASEDSRYLSRRADLHWTNSVLLPDFGAARQNQVVLDLDRINERAEQRLASSSSFGPYLARVSAADRRRSAALGVQSELAKRLTLTGNIREDWVSGVGDAFTWRVGGALAVPALASHVKASYGTAFLAPSLFDRYGVDNGGYVGNPTLLPERSHGYEIGWSSAFGANNVSVTYFHTNVGNLINTVFAPVYTSVNVAGARLQGVETAVSLHPLAWLDADISYTYTDARRVSGALLLRRPYNTGAVTLTMRPLPLLSVVPSLVFSGGDRDYLVDDAGFPTGVGRNRGGVIANLNVSYRVRPGVQLFVWGRNLAGSRLEGASGYATPRASVLAGGSIGF